MQKLTIWVTYGPRACPEKTRFCLSWGMRQGLGASQIELGMNKFNFTHLEGWRIPQKDKILSFGNMRQAQDEVQFVQNRKNGQGKKLPSQIFTFQGLGGLAHATGRQHCNFCGHAPSSEVH